MIGDHRDRHTVNAGVNARRAGPPSEIGRAVPFLKRSRDGSSSLVLLSRTAISITPMTTVSPRRSISTSPVAELTAIDECHYRHFGSMRSLNVNT